MTEALVGYYDEDALRLRYRASAAPASLDAYVLYEQPDRPGIAYRDSIPQLTSFTTDRTEVTLEGETSGGAGGAPGCNITGGGVFIRPSATVVRRGAFYVRFVIARHGSAVEECICCGYVYDGHPFLSVGEHVEPGPGGGMGNLIIEAIALDVAPAATTTFSATANAIRRVYGFAWYYNAAAVVASRTLNVAVRKPLGVTPTGFAGAGDVWVSTTVTLTTGEEGIVYLNAVDGKEFVSFNDNTAMTYASTATSPSPFPLFMNGADTGTVSFVVAAGEATDVHSIYVLYEEWLMP